MNAVVLGVAAGPVCCDRNATPLIPWPRLTHEERVRVPGVYEGSLAGIFLLAFFCVLAAVPVEPRGAGGGARMPRHDA